MRPTTTTRPRRRIEVWRPPARPPRRRPPAPLPVALLRVPPPTIETQLAALEAELRAWGREALT